MELTDIWEKALGTIETKLDSKPDFNTWFTGTSIVEIVDKTVTIGCKSNFAAEYMGRSFNDLVLGALSQHLEKEISTVTFVVGRGTTVTDVGSEITDPLFIHQQEQINEQKRFDNKLVNSGLNIRYTFDGFVVGSSNRLAHAAALAIADNPGVTYNPFYVYGGVGLGKTHIMQAIGHHVLRNNINANIYYCSCESFLNELVSAIRSNKTAEFRAKYRELDVLMIDDIQFISNKLETQKELFSTFNELHMADKQIILASDRPPQEIQDLSDRLKSRFQGGMVADINQPDYETRVAILTKKCEEKGFEIPQHTLEHIAKLIESNIRELEGALLRIMAFAGINDGKLSEKEVSKILGKDAQSIRKKVKPRDIIDEVCNQFDLSIRDIRGRRRTADVAMARQIAMYLLRTSLDLPLTKVAKELNRNDHTTVIHAVDKVETVTSENEEIAEKIVSIKQNLSL